MVFNSITKNISKWRILKTNIFLFHQVTLVIYSVKMCIMKIYEKIRFMRQSKGWSQEEMANKLSLSVNGYANIERGETDVQLSRLEQIAATLEIELLELLNLGERQVFYLVNSNLNNNLFNSDHNNFEMTDVLQDKMKLQHELEKTCLLLEQKEIEITYLKKLLNLTNQQNET